MAAAAASKRRRLQSIAGTGHLTDAALLRVAERLREDPAILDALSSRKPLQRATHDLLQPLLQSDALPLKSGGEFERLHASPQKIVQFFYAESPAYKAMVDRALQTARASVQMPWRVVLYADECTPGNPLRPEARRKLHCWYFAFLEFGQKVLCHAEAWLPVALLRTTVAKDVQGKFSCAMRALLRRFFCGPEGMSTGGILLGERLVFAELGNILADEACLKATWATKGASSFLPCPLCKNIVQHGLAEASAGGYLQSLACSDVGLFDLLQPGDLWRKHDRLEALAGAVSKAELGESEKSAGVNYCPNGVLKDRELRAFVVPERVHTFDNMHNLLSNGAASWEVFNMVQHLRTLGVDRSALQSFLTPWRWPVDKKVKSASLRDAFCDFRFGGDGHYKAGASELLQLLPVMLHMLLTVILPTGRAVREIASFVALCRVVCLMQKAKFQQGGATSETLLQAVQSHMRAFQDAYGVGEIKPKHHYELHVPAQVRRDGLLLDTYVQERKHQLIKHCAEPVDNVRSLEKTTLARVLQEQLRELERPGWTAGLLGRQQPFPELAEFMGASHATSAPRLRTLDGVMVGLNDIVWAQGALAKVRVCAQCGDEVVLVVNYMTDLRPTTEWAWEGGVAGAPSVVPARNVQQTHCWTAKENGVIVVLG